MRFRNAWCIVALLALFLGPQTLYSQTNIPSGTITTDTTWDVSGSPFVISCGYVTVDAGVNLTIAPGVVVKFLNGCTTGMVINGNLVANGTASQPIVSRKGRTAMIKVGLFVRLEAKPDKEATVREMLKSRSTQSTEIYIRADPSKKT